jgi:uncharacterized protein YuzE
MAESIVYGTPKITTSKETGAIYAQVSKGSVNYSVEIQEMVVADYDVTGNLVGVEILDSKIPVADIQKFLDLAKRSTRGRREGYDKVEIPSE